MFHDSALIDAASASVNASLRPAASPDHTRPNDSLSSTRLPPTTIHHHQPHHSHSFPQLAAPHSFKPPSPPPARQSLHRRYLGLANITPSCVSSCASSFQIHEPFRRTSLDVGLALHCLLHNNLSRHSSPIKGDNVDFSSTWADCTLATPYHHCPSFKADPAGQHRIGTR